MSRHRACYFVALVAITLPHRRCPNNFQRFGVPLKKKKILKNKFFIRMLVLGPNKTVAVVALSLRSLRLKILSICELCVNFAFLAVKKKNT